jgi:hypothetical protein
MIERARDDRGQPEADQAVRQAEHLELARELAALPCNQDGADKTWVLDLMRRLERLFASAKMLPGRGPDGSLP